MTDIFLTLTTYTYQKIATLPGKRKHNALSLYMFYYYHAKFQNTNQPWTTIPFCANGMGWSIPTVRMAKKDLEDLGLIKDIHASGRKGKAYIQINYMTKKGTTEEVFCTTKNLRSKKIYTKCLKSINKDKCLKNKKTLSKDNNSPGRRVKLKSKSFVNNVVKDRKLPKINLSAKSSKSDLRKKAKTMKIDPYKTNSVPKPKYSYSVSDFTLYNTLIGLGATKHREKNKSYYRTMDLIHELLNKSLKNPYIRSQNYLVKEFKDKTWTLDEVADAFEQYVKTTDNKAYRTISNFIFMAHGGTQSWSPLLMYFKKMQAGNEELTGDEKRLMKELERMNITDLDSTKVKKAVKLFYYYTEGYQVPLQYNHIYHGRPIYVFTDHIREKMRSSSFKPYFIMSENFIKDFINNSKQSRLLVKGNNNAVY